MLSFQEMYGFIAKMVLEIQHGVVSYHFKFEFSDSKILVISSKKGLMRHYFPKENNEFRLERTWKSTHNGPIRLMCFDPTSTFLATGGSDGTVKVWDVIRKFCTHNLKVSRLIETAVIHAYTVHRTLSGRKLFGKSPF